MAMRLAEQPRGRRHRTARRARPRSEPVQPAHAGSSATHGKADVRSAQSRAAGGVAAALEAKGPRSHTWGAFMAAKPGIRASKSSFCRPAAAVPAAPATPGAGPGWCSSRRPCWRACLSSEPRSRLRLLRRRWSRLLLRRRSRLRLRLRLPRLSRRRRSLLQLRLRRRSLLLLRLRRRSLPLLRLRRRSLLLLRLRRRSACRPMPWWAAARCSLSCCCTRRSTFSSYSLSGSGAAAAAGPWPRGCPSVCCCSSRCRRCCRLSCLRRRVTASAESLS